MIPLDGLDFKYIHCAIWFPSLLLLYFVQKKKITFCDAFANSAVNGNSRNFMFKRNWDIETLLSVCSDYSVNTFNL